jgi:hypothetical protein
MAWLQLRLLKRYIAVANWWLRANALAGAVVGGVVLIMLRLEAAYVANGALALVLNLLVAATLLGSITGLTLASLLARSDDRPAVGREAALAMD